MPQDDWDALWRDTYEEILPYVTAEALRVVEREGGDEDAQAEAVAYATQRAAELVGMRVQPDGSLIPNPDSQWAISDTTRAAIRELVTQAAAEGWAPGALQEAISDSVAFSPSRAAVVARTELAFVHRAATLASGRALGAEKKQWDADEEACEYCKDLDGVTIELEDEFEDASGTYDNCDGPPLHPNCTCSVVLLTEEMAAEEGEEGGEEEVVPPEETSPEEEEGEGEEESEKLLKDWNPDQPKLLKRATPKIRLYGVKADSPFVQAVKEGWANIPVPIRDFALKADLTLYLVKDGVYGRAAGWQEAKDETLIGAYEAPNTIYLKKLGNDTPELSFLHEFGHFVVDTLGGPAGQMTDLSDLLKEFKQTWKEEAPIAFKEMSDDERDDYAYYLKRGNGCGHEDPCDEAFAELFAVALGVQVEGHRLATYLPECAFVVRRVIRALSGGLNGEKFEKGFNPDQPRGGD